MKKVLDYIKSNRDDTVTLGIVIMTFGIALGVSLSMQGHEIIADFLFWGLFPIGAFILLLGYHIRNYNTHELLKRCIIIITIGVIFLFIEFLIMRAYPRYPFGIITISISSIGFQLMKKTK